jgi:aminobenzoyl-glutamate utilization protein B
VVTSGGGQPNVVPPAAEVWYYIRANRHLDVEDYFEWVNEIAKAAAAMSRTKLDAVQVDADMHEVLPNRALSEALQRNLEMVGAPRFTDEEKEFARKTQADLARAPEKALSEEIEPLPDHPEQELASTDVGDISWFVPVGELSVASYTYGAPGHSWQIVACTGTTIGEKGMLVAAKTLAATAVDLFASPELVTRAKADFEAIRKPLEFVTLIPEGQKAPKTIR